MIPSLVRGKWMGAPEALSEPEPQASHEACLLCSSAFGADVVGRLPERARTLDADVGRELAADLVAQPQPGRCLG